MEKAKVSEFVAYVKSKVGSPYLWGGQGESLTALVKKLAKSKTQSDANTEKMLAFMTAHGYKDIEFFDCSGLGVAFLLAKGAIAYDMTANGLYKACSKISKSDVRIGDMGFLLSTEGNAYHIGYVTDNGMITHAFNQSKGVIVEPITSRKWVFGRPYFCLEYDLGKKLVVGETVTINNPIKGYNNALNAKLKVKSTVTYPVGTYYVYKIYGGAVNISRKKGVAGAWVVL